MNKVNLIILISLLIIKSTCTTCDQPSDCTDQICKGGTCTDAETCEPVCEDQTCIEGACYTVCKDDFQCPTGLICYEDSCVECANNFNCSDPEATFCNLDSFECVQCKENLDCDGQVCNTEDFICQDCYPACEEGKTCLNNICKECADDSYCGESQFCDLSSFTCTFCLSHSHCQSNEFCSDKTDPNQCVECRDQGDCPIGKYCNLFTNECEVCQGCTEEQVCNLETEECVECTTDDHCSQTNLTKCNTSTNVCVECIQDNDTCTSGGDLSLQCTADNTCTPCGGTCSTPEHCHSDGSCHECLDTSGCTSPNQCLVQDGSQNTCVQCLSGDHCSSPTPVCSQNSCVECENDEQCSEGLCKSDQNCAPCRDACSGTMGNSDFICGQDNENCVMCVEDGDCSGSSVCLEDTCVECKVNDDCSSNETNQYCNTTDNECVPCSGTDGCLEYQVCNNSYTCKDGSIGTDCTDNSDCYDYLICNTDTSTCQMCQSDSDCNNTGSYLVCNSNNLCVAGVNGSNCQDDSDCADNLECDLDDNTCKNCYTDAFCQQGEGSESQLCISNECTDASIGASCSSNIECMSNICDVGQSNSCVECLNFETDCDGEQYNLCTDNTCIDGSDGYNCTEDNQCLTKCIDSVCGCNVKTDCPGQSENENILCSGSKICIEGIENQSCTINQDCQDIECTEDCPVFICDVDGTQQCKQCLDNTHCSNGICQNYQCIDGELNKICDSNDDCLEELFCKIYKEGDNLCKQCDNENACSIETQYCSDSLSCENCLEDSHCDQSNNEVCNNSYECRDGSIDQICSDNSDCINVCFEEVCVVCIENNDCVTENDICTNENTCVQGLNGDDCTHDSFCLNRCETTEEVCVQCLNDGDCNSEDSNQVCNDSYECVDGSLESDCSDNSDCIDKCDGESKKCVSCLVDDDCEGAFICTNIFECVDGNIDSDCTNDTFCLNRCNLDTQKCSECVEESDCDQKYFVCSDDSVCVDGKLGSSCQNSSECQNVCDSTIYKCVICLSTADCEDGFVCDVNNNTDSQDNVCVECYNNDHCPIGICENNLCVHECTEDYECENKNSPVCTDKKYCGPCTQSTDCYKFEDAQICEPTTNYCIAELQVEDDCCDQPSDLVTNTSPQIVESFLVDSPIVSLFFEIKTEVYKQKLYFVSLFVDGVAKNVESVDNQTIGQLTLNIKQENFTKGQNQKIKVYASYTPQTDRRNLNTNSNLIKFEKQIKITDKQAIQSEQPIKTQVETKEETDYLYLYIIIPVAVVFMLAIALIAFKSGQQKSKKQIEDKIQEKKSKQYIDTENLELKDEK